MVISMATHSKTNVEWFANAAESGEPCQLILQSLDEAQLVSAKLLERGVYTNVVAFSKLWVVKAAPSQMAKVG